MRPAAARLLVGALLAAIGCNAISGVGDLSFKQTDAGAPDGGGRGAGGGDGPSSSSVSTGATSAGGASATSTVVAGSSMVSAGSSGGGGGGLPCANGSCAAGEVCCHNGNSPENDYCGQPGGCLAGEAEMACAGPNDCPNTQGCCGLWNGSDNWSNSACANQCGGNWFCGSDRPCPAGTCTAEPLLGAGYGWCSP